MRRITTQKLARPARFLSFCFNCGKPFTSEPEHVNTPDHIPPKTVINVPDRNFPLKVACHLSCNQDQSVADTRSGQLVGASRGEYPKEERNYALEVAPFQLDSSDNPIGILLNVNLHREIWRWVRAFHASLYGEFLPHDVPHQVFPPFPTGEITTKGPEFREQHLPLHAAIVRQIKNNLAADCYDKISCNNDKVQYVCLWARPLPTDDWECWFALKIYDWQDLTDARFPRRQCVGRYSVHRKDLPDAASVAVFIEIPVGNRSALDPFVD